LLFFVFVSLFIGGWGIFPNVCRDCLVIDTKHLRDVPIRRLRLQLLDARGYPWRKSFCFKRARRRRVKEISDQKSLFYRVPVLCLAVAASRHVLTFRQLAKGSAMSPGELTVLLTVYHWLSH
jgi:hypothetical protein